MNTGTFALYLVPTVIKLVNRRYHQYTPLESQSLTGEFTVKETAVLSSQFCILWFLSNLLNNASYFYTSVVSATIISCTSSFFTLIIGSAFKVETFTSRKLFSLLVSFAGVILISRADDTDDELREDAQNPLLGNLFALGSACLYGVYTTMLKVKIGDESRINTRLFFGFVGLFNILALWPFLLILDRLNIEKLGLPTNAFSWSLLLINSAATLTSDFCWVLAMLMTSPLVVTVGLSATIPLSMIGDMMLHHRYSSFWYYIGAAMVCWSFFVINRESEEDALDETNHED